MLESEAEHLKPRPYPRGWGQGENFGIEAEIRRLRPMSPVWPRSFNFSDVNCAQRDIGMWVVTVYWWTFLLHVFPVGFALRFFAFLTLFICCCSNIVVVCLQITCYLLYVMWQLVGYSWSVSGTEYLNCCCNWSHTWRTSLRASHHCLLMKSGDSLCTGLFVTFGLCISLLLRFIHGTFYWRWCRL